jgi:hypothetical protein
MPVTDDMKVRLSSERATDFENGKGTDVSLVNDTQQTVGIPSS